ncbi:MAG: hypothetical protein NC078_07130 [Ruminococcus sp.]|nr:hypothetical protein [Ruminococcus sp.]
MLFAAKRYGIKPAVIIIVSEIFMITFAVTCHGSNAALLYGFTAVLIPLSFTMSAVIRIRAVRENEGRERVYVFCEKYFTEIFGDSEIKVSYDCCEAFEGNGYFFIIAVKNSPRSGFVIDKTDLENEDRFREFLREKFGKDFKETNA